MRPIIKMKSVVETCMGAGASPAGGTSRLQPSPHPGFPKRSRRHSQTPLQSFRSRGGCLTAFPARKQYFFTMQQDLLANFARFDGGGGGAGYRNKDFFFPKEFLGGLAGGFDGREEGGAGGGSLYQPPGSKSTPV